MPASYFETTAYAMYRRAWEPEEWITKCKHQTPPFASPCDYYKVTGGTSEEAEGVLLDHWYQVHDRDPDSDSHSDSVSRPKQWCRPEQRHG